MIIEVLGRNLCSEFFAGEYVLSGGEGDDFATL